jgi:hypothetical protein
MVHRQEDDRRRNVGRRLVEDEGLAPAGKASAATST